MLDSPAHTSTDNCLVQFNLGLGQRSLGAGLLGWEKRRNPRLYRLFRSGGGSDTSEAAFYKILEPLEFAPRDVSRIESLQLL